MDLCEVLSVPYLSEYRTSTAGAREAQGEIAPEQRRRSGKRKRKLIYSCDKNFINICLSGAFGCDFSQTCHEAREIWIVQMLISSQHSAGFRCCYSSTLPPSPVSLAMNYWRKFISKCFNQELVGFPHRSSANWFHWEQLQLNSTRSVDVTEEIKNFYLIRETNKLIHNCLMTGCHSPAHVSRGDMKRCTSPTKSAILMKFIDPTGSSAGTMWLI